MLDVTQNRTPFIARGDISIQAPIELVWWLESDLENWPTWKTDVDYVSLTGAPEEGGDFLWSSGGIVVRSHIVMYKEPSTISWIDHTMGIESLHVWEFDGEGMQTMAHVTQTWSGWPDPVLRLAAKHFLDHTLYRSLAALKRRAEQLSSGLTNRRASTLSA